MFWITVLNLIISAVTLITVFIKINERKIDRQIEVTIVERRRMQQELFKNVLGILEIERELQYEKFLKEKDILFNEVLNYKVGVWINLNRENSFSEDLRSNCTSLATFLASALDEISDDNAVRSYLNMANSKRQYIWVLIDKYIDEEEEIVKLIVAGKKSKK